VERKPRKGGICEELFSLGSKPSPRVEAMAHGLGDGSDDSSVALFVVRSRERQERQSTTLSVKIRQII
jgi:hypothetical protein